MLSAIKGTWAFYRKKTLRAAPCLLVGAVALFMAESVWAQGIITYSGASVGANGTIYGWGVTDAYPPGMNHTAYVTTWLNSPHGRSAVVYDAQAPTWVRADVSLPWDNNDLGLYLASSSHAYYSRWRISDLGTQSLISKYALALLLGQVHVAGADPGFVGSAISRRDSFLILVSDPG